MLSGILLCRMMLYTSVQISPYSSTQVHVHHVVDSVRISPCVGGQDYIDSVVMLWCAMYMRKYLLQTIETSDGCCGVHNYAHTVCIHTQFIVNPSVLCMLYGPTESPHQHQLNIRWLLRSRYVSTSLWIFPYGNHKHLPIATHIHFNSGKCITYFAFCDLKGYSLVPIVSLATYSGQLSLLWQVWLILAEWHGLAHRSVRRRLSCLHNH